jgi:mono/diheme cytochrome c family protein
MPAYADQLSPEQIRLVAAYVFTLSHPGSVVPDSLGLPADTAVRRDTLPRRR